MRRLLVVAAILTVAPSVWAGTPRFHGEVRPASAPVHHPLASGGNILFLNFDGDTLTEGSDDSTSDQSAIAVGTANVPAFAPPAGAVYTRQQGIDAITDRVRTIYKPFNVEVVSARPGSGDYTMVMVGGSHTVIPGEDQAAGVCELDCTNSNPDNVCYDFAADLTPDYGGIPEIAVDAAHESGHSYGLEHTDNPSDIMYSVATPTSTLQDVFAQRFTTGNYSAFNAGGGSVARCPGRGTALDNVALLDTAVGAGVSSDTTAPTLQWTFPQLPTVPTTIPLQFTASDNVGVVRLEVYKNFDMVAVLTQAPYATTLTAADQESFYLTVEAIDAAANRTTLTKAFSVDATIPPLCPAGTCSMGRTCEEGICRLPIGSACTLTVQCSKDACRMPVGTTGTICTQNCSASTPCPSGYACGSDDLCAPMTTPVLKMNGDSCGAAAECQTGRCQGVCVPACDNGATCDDGLSCILVAGGEGCVVPATPSPMPKKSSGCDTTPSPTPPGFLILMLLALAFTLRIRSR